VAEADAAAVVRLLFELFEARRWDDASALLASDVVVDWPATGERFVGRERFVGMQRAYPEGWSIEVVRVLAVGDQVASEVRVTHHDATFAAAGFWTVADGLIRSGAEYWVTVGGEEPPAWRSAWTADG
jgi:ketosteroid isomerase-like protein